MRKALTAAVMTALSMWASAARAGESTVGDIAITTTRVSKAIEADLAPVPEPASLLLFGTGLGIAARQLRKRSVQNA